MSQGQGLGRLDEERSGPCSGPPVRVAGSGRGRATALSCLLLLFLLEVKQGRKERIILVSRDSSSSFLWDCPTHPLEWKFRMSENPGGGARMGPGGWSTSLDL